MRSPFYGAEEEGVCTDANQTGQIQIRRSSASRILSNHEKKPDSAAFDYCIFYYLCQLLLLAYPSALHLPYGMQIPWTSPPEAAPPSRPLHFDQILVTGSHCEGNAISSGLAGFKAQGSAGASCR